MSLLTSIARAAARTDFARSAMEEKADLAFFREKPSARAVTGLVLMAFSYLIGWPAVALFGILSIYSKEPLIVIIGGPAIYGTSHLVFLAGLYLAGAGYAHALFRWATRRFLERFHAAAPEAGGEERAS